MPRQALTRRSSNTRPTVRNGQNLINTENVHGDGSNLSGDAKFCRGDLTGKSGVLTINHVGDLSGLRGPVTNIFGDTSFIHGTVHANLVGDAIGKSGNITGIYGDMTDFEGNFDECGLTAQERQAGVDIETLVATLRAR